MQKDDFSQIQNYYSESIKFAKSHYENFPVISLFVKKKLRKYTSVIYQFARQADDIADEGSHLPEKRIELLDEYEKDFRNALENIFRNGFWLVLRDTIDYNNLSKENFLDLLQAFRQDIQKNRYDDFDDLLNYCRKSANPVGRLILELHGIQEPLLKGLSDKICTALQLTNFYQDISIDFKKNRIYIPLAELNIFNVRFNDEMNFQYDENFIRLMKYQVDRVKKLFSEGRELLKYLPPRLKIQILVTIKGGEAILRKIEERNYNVLDFRPALSKLNFIMLFINAIIFGK